jgi:transposase
LSVVVMLECPPLLYELCVRPCGDQQRRARVPQVVEPQPLLLSWQRRLGRTEHAPHEHRAFELRQLAVVAVESSGCSAAGLVRYLRSQGMRVLEVNQPHAHPRRRLGKSDPLDAELAARRALAGKVSAIPEQTDGIVESIRQLRVARQGAVKVRGAAMATEGPDRHGFRAAARAALRAQDDPRHGEPKKAENSRNAFSGAARTGAPAFPASKRMAQPEADRLTRERSLVRTEPRHAGEGPYSRP